MRVPEPSLDKALGWVPCVTPRAPATQSPLRHRRLRPQQAPAVPTLIQSCREGKLSHPELRAPETEAEKAN